MLKDWRQWWQKSEVALALVHARQGLVAVNPAMQAQLGPLGQESGPWPLNHPQLPPWCVPPPECFHGKPQVLVEQQQEQGLVVFYLPQGAEDSPTVLVAAVAQPPELVSPWQWLVSPSTEAFRHIRQQLAQRPEDPWPGMCLGNSPAATRLRAQVQLALGSNEPFLIRGPAGSGHLELARWIFQRWAPGSVGLLVLDASLLSQEMFLSTLTTFLEQEVDFPLPGAPPQNTSRMVLLHRLEQLPEELHPKLVELWQQEDSQVRWVGTWVAEGPVRESALIQLLGVLELQLVPLAQRTHDLLPMAQFLLQQEGSRVQGLAPEVQQRLQEYPWPGQWDELRQVIRRAARRAASPWIRLEDLPRALRTWEPVCEASPETIDLDRLLAQVQRRLLLYALEQSGGNKAEAARRLGLSRPQLYRRMKEVGLEP